MISLVSELLDPLVGDAEHLACLPHCHIGIQQRSCSIATGLRSGSMSLGLSRRGLSSLVNRRFEFIGHGNSDLHLEVSHICFKKL